MSYESAFGVVHPEKPGETREVSIFTGNVPKRPRYCGRVALDCFKVLLLQAGLEFGEAITFIDHLGRNVDLEASGEVSTSLSSIASDFGIGDDYVITRLAKELGAEEYHYAYNVSLKADGSVTLQDAYEHTVIGKLNDDEIFEPMATILDSRHPVVPVRSL